MSSLTTFQDVYLETKKKPLYKRLLTNTQAKVGFFILFWVILFAILAPLFSGYTYFEINLKIKNQSPSLSHLFGTDDLGRDVFTRVWYGARVSLSIGLMAAIIDVVLGILYGGIAAYVGGKVEEVMMRLADLLYSIPYLMTVILLSLCLGSGFFSILAAMTIYGWITMARIIRGKVASLKTQEFVLAAQTMGAGFPRIFFKHLIPNCMDIIIVTLTTTIPSAIFVEAYLSFLGLGIQAPVASWGSMAYDGLAALSFYPWRLIFPAAAISLTMLSFNLIGDALSKVFDLREFHL